MLAWYLWRGDHEGPQGAIGAQRLHSSHVLIRGPRGRVHNQVIQLSPGHVRHELLYQRCRDPGVSASPSPTASAGPGSVSTAVEQATPYGG